MVIGIQNIFWVIRGMFVDAISISWSGYLCIGYEGSNLGFAIQMGPNYNLGWWIYFPGINGVIPYFAQETKDGGFLMSGTAMDSSNNNIPWMTKIDQNGNIPTRMSEIKKSVDNIQIKCLNNSIEIDQAIGDKLIISDMNGRVVQSFEEISDKFVFNFNERGGIYIFSFYNLNELVESKKVFIPFR